MRRLTFGTIVLLTVCFVFVAVSRAEELTERTTDSFREVQAESLRLGRKYGNDKVLLVFDVDNTLLAMRQDLGSDQWFAWQESLPATDPQSVGDFPTLLRVQGLLFAVSSMRPTQPDQPEIVVQLQQAGFTTTLLTSRGFDFRDATRRELLANGYNFRKSALRVSYKRMALTPRAGFAGPYCPYDVSQLGQSGISREEAEKWLAVRDSNPVQIKKPRLVSYNEGLYMTAGQNKGVMLRMLLHKSGKVGKFKAIVFVDDHPRHTRRIREAFANQSVEIVTFRYSREDANVRRFEASRNGEKRRAAQLWRRLKQTLDELTHSTLNAPPAPSPECVSSTASK